MLIPGLCTQCGATLSVDKEKDAMICPHCGTPFIVEKAIQKYSVINNIYAQNVIVQGDKSDFFVEAGKLVKYTGSSKEVVIPENVEIIGESCFANMNIVSVEIPETVTMIEKSAFGWCKSLDNINIPKTVKQIQSYAFRSCSSLREIDISHINNLGGGCFESSGVQKVILSDVLKIIPGMCFSGCTQLSDINIPSSLECIEKRAFAYCKNLKTIDFNSKLKLEIGAFLESGLQAVNIQFPISVQYEEWDSYFYEDVSCFENFVNHARDIFYGSPYGKELQEQYVRSVKNDRIKNNLCIYCGSKFKGLLTTRCSKCGKTKNY